MERGERSERHSFIFFPVKVRKGTDTYGKAVAVPSIGVINEEKDASNRPGLC